MRHPAEEVPGYLLVTGALGFLGSEIIRQATTLGLRVRGTGRQDVRTVALPDYRRADILDAEALRATMEGIDAVIHTAGLAHIFDRSRASRSAFARYNEIGTLTVARVAAEAGVRHLMLTSSVAVYGRCHELMPRGETARCHPETPYAESKWRAERRAEEVAGRSGMRLTVLRLATLYGEGDPGNVARLIRLIDRRRFVWIGDGRNRKSLLYRGDAAHAFLRVATTRGVGIETYNVSGRSCSVRELVECIASALGRPCPGWGVPAALADGATRYVSKLTGTCGAFGAAAAAIRMWLSDDVYDSRKFESLFGFKANIGLGEGIRREVAWYRQSKQGIARR